MWFVESGNNRLAHLSDNVITHPWREGGNAMYLESNRIMTMGTNMAHTATGSQVGDATISEVQAHWDRMEPGHSHGVTGCCSLHPGFN